jgi:single-strand DNA-binding protein
MLNRVILIGRATADPEIKYTPSGIALGRFRLAVNRSYKNKQGQRETDFIDIVVWRKLAELVGEYVKKGRLVAVEGQLQSRNWETKEGAKRTSYEVVGENVQFLESRKPAGAESAPTDGMEAPPPPNEESIGEPSEPAGDDLPF